MDRETKEFLRGLAIFSGFIADLIITVRVAAGEQEPPQIEPASDIVHIPEG